MNEIFARAMAVAIQPNSAGGRLLGSYVKLGGTVAQVQAAISKSDVPQVEILSDSQEVSLNCIDMCVIGDADCSL